MYHGRRDHTKHAVVRRAATWSAVIAALLRRKRNLQRRSFREIRRSSRLLLYALKQASYRFNERPLHFHRVSEIQVHSWDYILNEWTDLQWQEAFRINKQQLETLVKVLSWPFNRTVTKSNKYSTNTTISTLIVLRRLASPCRWSNLSYVLYKHPVQMSEIFWETLHRCWRVHANILTGPLSAGFFGCQTCHVRRHH